MITDQQLAALGDKYNKIALEEGFLPLVKNFYKKLSGKTDIAVVLKDILQKHDSKKQVTKIELMQLCFSVFINETIYKEFLSTLPGNISRLIEKLLWVESLSEEEIELLTEEPISEPDGSLQYSKGKALKKEYYFFSVNNIQLSWYSSPEPAFILSLSPIFKQILIPYYPKPVNYYFVPLDEIPTTYFRFNSETNIMPELPRVISYYLQDGIKYSSKGKPQDGTLGKLQRSCNITEFFPAMQDISGKVRGAMIAGMLYDSKIKDISLDVAATIKELFTNQYPNLNTVPFILLQIKGWGYLNEYDYYSKIEFGLMNLLKEIPIDKWVSINNLLGYIQSRLIKLQPVSDYSIGYTLFYDNPKDDDGRGYNYNPKSYISTARTNKLVTIPFIKGTIFLFAAFGLIEIAYEGIDAKSYPKTYSSAYDGLMYFKLTALGAYVLGHTKTYAGSLEQQKNKLQLSEDSLMILAEGDLSVIDIMLANFAEKAGTNRYKVSHAHFLKNCQSVNDIEKKITAFKRTIALPLPEHWRVQFNTWQINVSKISEQVNTLVFKIAADDKLLQKLIAQDPILKELILKAEQFHILVKSSNVAKFKIRLKELSYLVE